METNALVRALRHRVCARTSHDYRPTGMAEVVVDAPGGTYEATAFTELCARCGDGQVLLERRADDA